MVFFEIELIDRIRIFFIEFHKNSLLIFLHRTILTETEFREEKQISWILITEARNKLFDVVPINLLLQGQIIPFKNFLNTFIDYSIMWSFDMR